MSMYNLKQAPYYDKYDWSKGQIQLLAIPGRVAQAREFTEIQSAMRHIIKSVGDSVMKNGDIIEGCQVIVSKDTKTVKVTPGKVYMDGMVLPIYTNYKETDSEGNIVAEYATVSIKAEPYLKEVIGIKIEETVITEDIDEETGQDLMKDPAQGYDNYNQPGCHRLRRVLKVVVDDPEAAPIATLIAGDIMVETYAPEYDTLIQTLARRTHDESGSYIVNGLKVGMEPISPGQELDDYYNITVDSGKAYILGYELGIPTTRRIRVRRAIDTELKYSIASHYYQDTKSEYQLDNRPYVESIKKVQAQALKENHQMTRNLSSNANEDKLPTNFSSRFLDRVWSVLPGGEEVEYKQNEHYELNEGGTNGVIKWIEGADAPTGSYYINYRYSHTYVQGADYSLVNRPDGSYLVWLDPSDTNKHPASNEPLTIEYKIYLARKDIVYIDREGNIVVLEGKPSLYGSEYLPETPLNTLVLANISNPPNGTARVTSTTDLITVSNVGLTRFTMHDIQRLLDRVQTMEYDQAVLTLNDDAKKVYTVNDKRGVWTEPFIDLSRIDFAYNLDGNGKLDPNKPIHDMALDIISNIGYLPVIATKYDLVLDEASAPPENYKYSRLLSLQNVNFATDDDGFIVQSQLKGTSTFQVNPYSTFPQIPEVIIDPAVDSWYDDTIIEVPVSLNNTEIVKLSSKSLDLRLPSMKNNSNWATRTRTYTKDTAIGTKTDTLISESIISESAVTYIRPRTIHVEGIDFLENLDNIECRFDGVLVPLRSTIHGGSTPGTVRADPFGTFQAEFDIPEGRLTGTREVNLKAKEPIDGIVTEASALYVAQGIARQIERTVTTVNTVLVKRVERSLVTAVYVDPIGQSFVLDRMTLISGVDVYFSAKPGNLSTIPILCEIRGVTNGTIDGTVYASKSLLPSEIEIDPVKGETATRFRFDNPVLVEGNTEYAFTLRSLSDAYRVWVSELGGTDVVTEKSVVKNDNIGVMFSSSNNSTWTEHQKSDLKFRLIEDNYNSSTTFTFQDIHVENAARLYLTADSVIPTGTAVDWSYRLGEDSTWQSIVPYNLAFIKDGYTGPVSLRLIMSKEDELNTRISPLVAIDTLSLEESHYVKKGCYISKPINNLDPYDEVQVILDWYNAPRGTSTLKVSISTDDGVTLQEVSPTKVDETNPASNDKETELGNGWVEKYYKLKLSSKATKCKVFIEFENTTEHDEVTYSTPAIRRLRCTMS